MLTFNRRQYEDDMEVTVWQVGPSHSWSDKQYYDDEYDFDNEFITEEEIDFLVDEFIESHDGNLNEEEINNFVDSLRTRNNVIDITSRVFREIKNPLISPDLIDYDDTLCCNLSKEDCQCHWKSESIVYGDPKLNFTEIYEKLVSKGVIDPRDELYEYAYDLDWDTKTVPCETCIHHGTYRCAPLRNWLRNIADDIYTGEIRHLDLNHANIDPCNNYKAKDNTPQEYVQKVQIMIAGRSLPIGKERIVDHDDAYISLEEFADEKVITLDEFVEELKEKK